MRQYNLFLSASCWKEVYCCFLSFLLPDIQTFNCSPDFSPQKEFKSRLSSLTNLLHDPLDIFCNFLLYIKIIIISDLSSNQQLLSSAAHLILYFN